MRLFLPVMPGNLGFVVFSRADEPSPVAPLFSLVSWYFADISCLFLSLPLCAMVAISGVCVANRVHSSWSVVSLSRHLRCVTHHTIE